MDTNLTEMTCYDRHGNRLGGIQWTEGEETVSLDDEQLARYSARCAEFEAATDRIWLAGR